MILCNKEDIKDIMNYIGEDYGKCLYLYIDLLKYGLTNKHINMWWQKSQNEISVLVFQYYSGVHVFSQNEEFDVNDVINLIKKISPSMICGMESVISKLAPYLSQDYELELGSVAELIDFKDFNDTVSYRAKENELPELAAFLSTDNSLGKPYGYELLKTQLLERYREGFGRNYIMRSHNEILATASTYAEKEKIAVISGVMVNPKYRGKGLSKKVLSALCRELKTNGMRVFSYYYIESAMRMHQAVGFKKIGNWAKLVQNNERGVSGE